MDYAKADGKAEGREEGLAEGREEGRAEGLAEGREEGWADGRAEEKLEIAKKLIAIGMPLGQIAAVTNLTLEDLKIVKP